MTLLRAYELIEASLIRLRTKEQLEKKYNQEIAKLTSNFKRELDEKDQEIVKKEQELNRLNQEIKEIQELNRLNQEIKKKDQEIAELKAKFALPEEHLKKQDADNIKN